MVGIIGMNKKLLKRIEQLFTERLKAKIGWGRNEVLQAYKDCVNEAISEILLPLLDEKTSPND